MSKNVNDKETTVFPTTEKEKDAYESINIMSIDNSNSNKLWKHLNRCCILMNVRPIK